MKRILGVLLLTMLVATACKTTKVAGGGDGTPSLLKFKKENVSKGEFERVYQKNNGGYDEAKLHTGDKYQEYLDLYINFKRKVFEAEALGLDDTPSFKQEFEGYRKQLAQPYLSAKEVETQLVTEAYERSKKMINANHLLRTLSAEATPADTLAAYNKILMLRDSVVKFNKKFEDVARNNSQDPSAKENKGNLGYFSVFDMVYPFESAAYKTASGSVSAPVRTQFGYHLIQVNEKINSSGEKTAAHIIIRVGDRYSAKDEKQAIEKIGEIHDMLKKGEDFATLAKQYSDDPTSAGKGGDLGSGRLLPEMEEIKMRMDKGDYSTPFKTRFGWHIMSVTDAQELKSLEEAKPYLRRKIERDSRSQLSKDVLISRLKKENNFLRNDVNFALFKKGLDANFPRGSWKPDSAIAEIASKTLFSFVADKGKMNTYTVQDFVNYYTEVRPRNMKASPGGAANILLGRYEARELIRIEEERLPEKNPEFRHLLKEYRDGILLFSLMEQKVWKKAVEDSVGLKGYYMANKSDYQANEMIDVKEYRTNDEASIRKVSEMIEKGESEEQIDEAINDDSALALRITTQTYEKGKSSINQQLFAKSSGYKSPVIEDNNFYKILIIKKKYPAGIKPFDKAKSECITKYQDHLESEWLKELESKYPVQVDEAVLQTLFQ